MRLITFPFLLLSLFLFTYYTGFTKRIFKYSYLGTSSERNLTVKLTHLFDAVEKEAASFKFCEFLLVDLKSGREGGILLCDFNCIVELG